MIDTEKLKVGDTLTAIDECIMDKSSWSDAGKPALIVGKKYSINHIIPNSKTIVISSEVDETHLFSTEMINKTFEHKLSTKN
jgi:hypothetical protein